VEVIEAKESFNWVSYVAEFSCWLGLFLGISVPHILSFLDKLTIKIRFPKSIPFLIKCMAYVLLSILFSQPAMFCITRFLDGPTATEIQIISPEKMPKVTISVCKNKKIYDFGFPLAPSFLGTEGFSWEDTLHI
jgi:hypothetical protein